MPRIAQLTELDRIVRSGTVASALQPDASVGGDVSNLIATGNITLSGPTNPVDAQVLRFRVRAQGADRTVTFSSTSTPKIVASTGITLGPYTVPRGRVLVAALEYCADRRTSTDAADPAWVLTAATVSG